MCDCGTLHVEFRLFIRYMSEMESTTTPALSKELLELLVCPLTKGPLDYDKAACELISHKAKLAYPVRSGIPILLPEEARKLGE